MTSSQSVYPGADYKVRVRKLPTGETIQAVYLDLGVGSSEAPLTSTGLPTLNAALALRVDEASATVTYIGEASPGTNESEAAWRIKRITDTGPVVIEWAAGAANFNQIWSNRSSLSYS